MLSGLIWVQTVCKDYQQTTLVGKELTSFPVKVTVMYLDTFEGRERSGSVVECLTQDRWAAGLSLTSVTALCP